MLPALLFGALLPGLAINVAGSCPDEAAIRQRLAVLLPNQAPEGRVQIELRKDLLLLSFAGEDTREESVRRVQGHLSCMQLALLAATLIASWQMERMGPAVETSAAPPAVPPAAPPAAPPDLPPPVSSPQARSYFRWEFHAAAEVGLAGASSALGAGLAVTLSPSRLPLHLRLGLYGLSFYHLPLGSGQAAWTRPAIELGLGYRLPLSDLPRWSVLLHAAVLPALLYSQGNGFEQSYSTFSFDVALGGGVQIGRQIGRFRPFLQVLLLGWLRPQAFLANDGSLLSASPPRFETLLGIGFTTVGERS